MTRIVHELAAGISNFSPGQIGRIKFTFVGGIGFLSDGNRKNVAGTWQDRV
jgi:superfamily I DNA and/or RNA helicase